MSERINFTFTGGHRMHRDQGRVVGSNLFE
jgi:hypothetical protein